MDDKKIKKSALTLTGIVLGLLFVMLMFFGLYKVMTAFGNQNGVEIDEKYNDTYNRLENSQNNISDSVDNIKDNLNDIKEADNTFQVAWNGLKGLGNTVLLPIAFVSSAVEMINITTIAADFIPQWILNIAILGMIVLIIFVILSIVKGDARL